MEMEAREILREGLSAKATQPCDIAVAIRRHVSSLGGVELMIPVREPVRQPPDFGN